MIWMFPGFRIRILSVSGPAISYSMPWSHLGSPMEPTSLLGAVQLILSLWRVSLPRGSLSTSQSLA